MSSLLEQPVGAAAPTDHPPGDPVRRAVGRAINVTLTLVIVLLAATGYGLYRAGQAIHGPRTINAAAVDGQVRLGLPKAAPFFVGAFAPYSVSVTVGKGFGGNWKYLHGKWGVWISRGSVGYVIDYTRIQPRADLPHRSATLVMPLPQLPPQTIHESGGKWSSLHCGITEHFATVITGGFDHACSLDSGDPKVRTAIDQAVARQVPQNHAAMMRAEKAAEAKFGPFVQSIIRSITGRTYTINFVWPSR